MPNRWDPRRVQLALLAVVLIGATVHNLALCRWTIEDAAITFGFAKHWIDGEGLVPHPGGEWVEAWSNPTWLVLMALVQLVGIDPFFGSHALGLLLSLATVLVVWRTAKEVAPDDSGVPLLATAFLAASSQFAIWGTAGLENPLWNLLFALGIYRTIVEIRPTEAGVFRFPWSAVAWVLLSLTRPEGILYAALGGFFHLAYTVARKRTIVPTLAWLLTFFVPWTAYQVWHYQTFAWPFPNTYYAKLFRHERMVFDWKARTWMWTRGFFQSTGQGFWLPVWVLGVVGREGWRLAAAGALVAVIGLVTELSDDQRFLLPVVLGLVWLGLHLALLRTEPDPTARRRVMAVATGVAAGLVVAAEVLRWLGYAPALLPVPEAAKTLPPYVLMVVAALTPLVGLRAPGASLRVPAWSFCCAAVLFAVYSEGDWMKGYRWYALATVPGSLLFAFGAHDLALLVEDVFAAARVRLGRLPALGPLGVAAAVVMVLAQIPPNAYGTWSVSQDSDASPRSVMPRIRYVARVAERIHWDEPITALDVDMGAHVLWTDYRMLDIAGLVDIPFAQHHWQPPFLKEHVFQEGKPLTMHIHGFWSTRSRVPSQPEFRRDYFELPPMPTSGENVHGGTYLRRDALLSREWPQGPTGVVRVAEDVALSPPVIPAAPATFGQVYVEVAMAHPARERSPAFRVVLFAADDEGVRRTWELPPGYDWLAPTTWGPREVFAGKFALPVGGLPPGTYDLGYVVTGGKGEVLPALSGPPGVVIGGGEAGPARLAAGEVRFPGALTVLTPEERDRAAQATLDAMAAAAGAGRCDEAEQGWRTARHHHEGDAAWAEARAGEVERGLARCWAVTSDGQTPTERIRRLLRAKRWDHHEPEFVARSRDLARELHAEGLEARAAEDWELAYRRFADSVALDGRQTWSRRYAEEARTIRLKLDDIPGDDGGPPPAGPDE